MFVRRAPMGLLHSLGLIDLGFRRNNLTQWQGIGLTEVGQKVTIKLGESLNPTELNPEDIGKELVSPDQDTEDSVLAISADSSQDR